MIDWAALHRAVSATHRADGFVFEPLAASEIETVVAGVRTWYPDIGVGTASGFVRAAFYRKQVAFATRSTGRVIVITIKYRGKIVGVAACEPDFCARVMYGRIVIVAPEFRGEGLGQRGIALIEAIARESGMGLVYGLATLKIPHVQRAFEQLDWRLIGIAPGYDREMIGGSGVKRVYEAVYAKVLAPSHEFEQPRPDNMTSGTRQLFVQLFSDELSDVPVRRQADAGFALAP
jgi:GNAT superfamily N-acetyltransferase